ncbi:single-stranded-DNA-specific exonuclease RecJ [Candidatus Peregrinibacteria bacterium CG_4_10_14_0_2_um_filter_38_24]|nr:MAG: single-stranded-DNA-specific exonuclease RecJ [Candidatus Peregrinibacteria bacterium CG_4_10_14_0_2_um_filter_38_24]
MSVFGKKWIIKNSNTSLSTFQKILENRGIVDEDEKLEFHDPFLFSDMEKAVKRIFSAIEKKERIIVFGDYDVDGITGNLILYSTLKKMGAVVSYRLPNRLKDGYGLSDKFIDEFIEKDINLVITVDCGISCRPQVAKAKENNIDVIITDHHTIPKEAPDAIAIIHPKYDTLYPFKDLTGAGVALKMAQALLLRTESQESIEERLKSLVDLAALGTVADLGPIKGENKYIVREGLKSLTNTAWPGLKKILKLSSTKETDEIDGSTIGFKIAPRINAAGRIGDPYTAMSLLLQEDDGEKVEKFGNELESLNIKRQDMTKIAMEEAEQIFLKGGLENKILIIESQDWHVGILGLVAGRLVEKYARPVILMQDFGDLLVGSARSPEYFNIVEALTAFGHLLPSFGGHAQAGGFNVKKQDLKEFKEQLIKYANEKLKDNDLKPSLTIDCELNPDEISFEFIEKMNKLKPFGIENSRPVFIMQGLEPYFIDQVGREKDHLKFIVKTKNKDVDVIGFRMGEFMSDIRQHKKIDLVFTIEKNVWNDKAKIQFKAIDFRENK